MASEAAIAETIRAPLPAAPYLPGVTGVVAEFWQMYIRSPRVQLACVGSGTKAAFSAVAVVVVLTLFPSF